jgi:hypothetical protein
MRRTPVDVTETDRLQFERPGLRIGTMQSVDIAPGDVVKLVNADPRRASITIGCIPLSGTVCFGRTQAEANEETSALLRPVVLDGIPFRLTHTGQLWAANHGAGVEPVAFFTEQWAT